MSNETPNNIVKFSIVAGKQTESAQSPDDETITDISTVPIENVEMYNSIHSLVTFLYENRDNLRYFVCGVAKKDSALGDDFASFNIFTSPIALAEFSMTIHMLQNSLFANLNAGID